MINEIYNKKILQFAADIPLLQRLVDPDATAVAHSRLCGSRVTVDLKMRNGVVTGSQRSNLVVADSGCGIGGGFLKRSVFARSAGRGRPRTSSEA